MLVILDLALVVLQLPARQPLQSNGFAAYIVGGFLGLGVLVLFMRWTSTRPKPPRRRR